MIQASISTSISWCSYGTTAAIAGDDEGMPMRIEVDDRAILVEYGIKGLLAGFTLVWI